MLNENYRPQSLDDVCGQSKAKRIVKSMLDKNKLSSMIFFGPAGTGKTTMANILASGFKRPLFKINGTSFSTQDFKDIMSKAGPGAIVYVDEIQYLTQKQQQLFLEPVESGKIILVAATADSPYHKVYKALLSRCVVVEFEAVSKPELVGNLKRILKHEGRENDFTDGALNIIAGLSGGDVRNSVKILELCLDVYGSGAVDEDDVKGVTASSAPIGYDGTDTFYDMMGCLQKSIRGSDIDASLYYLARMLNNGDILAVVRRLQVIASEDIGMANPTVPATVRACCESALDLGMPEASIPLHHAVALMALSPKSNAVHIAYGKANEDVMNGLGVNLPLHLQAPLFKGYLYPHNYPHNWVAQQYLPEEIKNRHYYVPGDNKTEKSLAEYWKAVKGQK